MIIWSIVLMAIREIRRNTLRSSLTTLGIVIGVAAVIAMVTLGHGATAKITADIAAMGNNLLIVSPGADRHRGGGADAGPFTAADVEAISRDVKGIEAVAPSAGKPFLIVAGNRNHSAGVTGSTNAYLEIRNYQLLDGRAFTDVELLGGAASCLLGATVRKELFGGQDPLGSTVRLGKLACLVVGTLKPKGASTFGNDQDDFVLMPLTAFQRRLAGNADINGVMVSVVSEKATVRVKAQIESLLRERRRVPPGLPDDFSVRDMQEISKTLGSVTGALTALLGAIAAVSLLVGGIGIMNIMLVSVTERTREIGIRLAIGARASEVLLQFLVEAVVLSVLGGIVGMGLGLLGSLAASRALGLPFVLVPWVVALAFVFSAAVGVCFGYFPARKAARLNPIEALRHE